MTNPIILIPARLASTRLPNKPLADINGKSMIQRIYEHVQTHTGYDVCIAAGDELIVEHVQSFGGQVVMTDPDLPSGSDRISAALQVLDPDQTKYDVVVNFQGDAVNTRPDIITELVTLLEEADADITTTGMVMSPALYNDPNAVKIVAGFPEGESVARCLYFSRALVPFDRDGIGCQHYHHIGIYVYKAAALRTFVSKPKGILENLEKLEQLRALENGMTIYVKLIEELKMISEAPADVDTPEELELARKYIF